MSLLCVVMFLLASPRQFRVLLPRILILVLHSIRLGRHNGSKQPSVLLMIRKQLVLFTFPGNGTL